MRSEPKEPTPRKFIPRQPAPGQFSSDKHNPDVGNFGQCDFGHYEEEGETTSKRYEFLAGQIVNANLAEFSLFFIEAIKPCSTLLHTAVLFFEPMLSVFFSMCKISDAKRSQLTLFKHILSDRCYLERFAEAINNYRNEHGGVKQTIGSGTK